MPIKVLVADDETSLHALVSQIFRRQIREREYEFVFAHNGYEALDTVKADEKIEIILTDINMPEMDGLTLLAELQVLAAERNSILTTIIISAYDDLKNIRQAMNRGAFDFLTKPIDQDDLRITLKKTVRYITERKQAAREQSLLLTIQRELGIAHEIQESLLPPPFPDWSGPDLICFNSPAHEIGGDLYAYYPIDDNRFAVAVGDVSGKGMPAALLMAVSLASFQATVGQGLSPGSLLTYLDQIIALYTQQTDQNCALLYLEFDLARLILRAANAGCISPYIKYMDGTLTRLDIGGIPLGVGLGAQSGYQETAVALSAGDFIILTSDGVIEAIGPNGDLLGFDRFEQIIYGGPTTSVEAMLEHIKKEVFTFTGETEQCDDMTIVIGQV